MVCLTTILGTTHQNAFNYATGIISGTPIPFEVTPKDACGNGLNCPVQAGLEQTYTATVQCPITTPVTISYNCVVSFSFFLY